MLSGGLREPRIRGTGAPNGTLDAGEDVNGNGTLDLYGGTPSYLGVPVQRATGRRRAACRNRHADHRDILPAGQAQ